MAAVSRHQPTLQSLLAWDCQIGDDAAHVLSVNLNWLKLLDLSCNIDLELGVLQIGRLPNLSSLDISTTQIKTGCTGVVGWSAVMLALNLRRAMLLRVSNAD